MKQTKTFRKRLLAAFLSLAMIFSLIQLSAFPASAETSDETSSDYEYELLSDGTALIIDYTGTATELIIPSELDGYTVTGIGYEAFAGCAFTSVTIPDSVKSIGYGAFAYCSLLESVTIGEGVESIGYDAFYDTGLYYDDNNWDNGALYIGEYLIDATGVSGEYEIKAGTKVIADDAFYECTSLTSITIPDSVKYIGYEAFASCGVLTSVTIGNGVESIGYDAFYNTGIYLDDGKWENGALYIGEYLIEADDVSGEYEIKEGTKVIAAGAFTRCDSLESVTIPDSVKSIGEIAFSCASLTGIEVAEDNANYSSDDRVLFNKDKTTVIQYPLSKAGDSYTIPDTVTSIGTGAFYGCGTLTSVEIPDSVKSIGEGAFSYCTSLTSVTIGVGVESIGGYAFDSCEALTSVEIPDSVKSIGEGAFYYCAALESVTIGEGVESIGDFAFYCCEALTSVEIPDSVKSIGERAFDGCAALESVTIGDGVESMGYSAFHDTGLSYDDNNSLYIGEYLIDATGVSGEYEIKAGTKLIADSAFEFCSELTSVTIPDSVKSIGDYAFKECVLLTSVEIPDSVTRIGEGAFYGCEELASVTIGEGVESIGNYAFEDCVLLTSVEIPDSVKSIGEGAFYDCEALESVAIGDGVKSIATGAFYRCVALESIAIGDGVESIGMMAFAGCISLTSVEIPDSVKSIGEGAFVECTLLTSVTIGDGVESIAAGTFYRCTSLKSVSIGNSIKSIGDEAFSGCDALETVSYNGTEEQWTQITFGIGNDVLVADSGADVYFYEASDYSGNYDGKPHGITVTVTKPEDAEITYSTDGTSYDETNPQFTDKGTYTVYYKIEKDGNAVATGSKKVTIQAAPVTVTAGAQTIIAGGTINNSKYTVTGLAEGDTISAVTLTPSTDKLTDNGTISVSGAKIVNAAGNDVTTNYDITYASGRLVINEQADTITNTGDGSAVIWLVLFMGSVFLAAGILRKKNYLAENSKRK